MTASNGQTADAKGLALVVDDVAINRKILETLLKIEGYQTVSAADGAQAVQQFIEQHPDIVFMDVMMPVMDGYLATTRIKELAGTAFVPVIFLTALSDGDALVKCIEAGGDDFLSKPFKQEILRAKIKAMERIRDLSRKVTEQHQKIERHHRQLLNEQIVAEQIYNRAITAENVVSKHIHTLLRAVSVFSGDVLLSAYRPDGALHVLLGDFTGHGLAAAVGVLPTAEVFRTMSAKGYAASEILAEINAKLHKLLPTGMFMTACFVVIEKGLHSATVWNAGMPEVLIVGMLNPDELNPVVKHRVASSYLALGILKHTDQELAPACVDIAAGDRILLCSDGVIEAVNSAGEEFGILRYERAAQHGFQSVVAALEGFCGEQPFKDDVSLAEIHCMPGLAHASVIDLSLLGRLMGSDPVKIQKFALKFLLSARQGMEEIEAALQRGSVAELAILGHRHKSPARTVGALGYADLCQALEKFKDGGNIEQARVVVAQMRALLQQIAARINRETL